MYESKYDTSVMRIRVEFTKRAQRSLLRLNKRNLGKRAPFQVICEMAEYIEHRMENGDPMISEFTVRYDDCLILTCFLSHGCYYITEVETGSGCVAIFPIYVWQRFKEDVRELLRQVLVGWSCVLQPCRLICMPCY